MTKNAMHLALFVMIAALGTQAACYNTYFIDTDELRKLESSVEPREVVDVYGDCPAGSQPAATSRYRVLGGELVAQNEAPADPAVATDAADASDAPDAANARPGCVMVPVSTANTIKVVGQEREYRVTPFNFIMSDSQLVSPEYDLLLPLGEIEGAEVKQFSAWKTVGAIAGVTALSVGTFVAVGLLAGEGGGFDN